MCLPDCEGERPLPRRGGAEVHGAARGGRRAPAGAEEGEPAAGEGEARPGDPDSAAEEGQDEPRG